jgi:hypothetical protein
MLRLMMMTCVALCLLCATAVPTYATPGCHFECVNYYQVGEWVLDTTSDQLCCYVDGDGFAAWDNEPCEGNHSPERQCYDRGWLYGDGAGCVCTPDEGDVEKCIDATVFRQPCRYRCDLEEGIPVCAPYALGNPQPLGTQVPAPCN